jgi:hypothetical protein
VVIRSWFAVSVTVKPQYRAGTREGNELSPLTWCRGEACVPSWPAGVGGSTPPASHSQAACAAGRRFVPTAMARIVRSSP